MRCPRCGGELSANYDTWTCKKCRRSYEIIEHNYGKTHRLVAGEVEFNPPKQ